jgi:hypothetical protein
LAAACLTPNYQNLLQAQKISPPPSNPSEAKIKRIDNMAIRISSVSTCPALKMLPEYKFAMKPRNSSTLAHSTSVQNRRHRTATTFQTSRIREARYSHQYEIRNLLFRVQIYGEHGSSPSSGERSGSPGLLRQGASPPHRELSLILH